MSLCLLDWTLHCVNEVWITTQISFFHTQMFFLQLILIVTLSSGPIFAFVSPFQSGDTETLSCSLVQSSCQCNWPIDEEDCFTQIVTVIVINGLKNKRRKFKKQQLFSLSLSLSLSFSVHHFCQNCASCHQSENKTLLCRERVSLSLRIKTQVDSRVLVFLASFLRGVLEGPQLSTRSRLELKVQLLMEQLSLGLSCNRIWWECATRLNLLVHSSLCTRQWPTWMEPSANEWWIYPDNGISSLQFTGSTY